MNTFQIGDEVAYTEVISGASYIPPVEDVTLTRYGVIVDIAPALAEPGLQAFDVPPIAVELFDNGGRRVLCYPGQLTPVGRTPEERLRAAAEAVLRDAGDDPDSGPLLRLKLAYG